LDAEGFAVAKSALDGREKNAEGKFLSGNYESQKFDFSSSRLPIDEYRFSYFRRECL